MADAELRADYDHDGRLTGSQPEYDARATPPGALVVANADADRRALPETVTGGRPVPLDYDQPTKSGTDDELLMLSVVIRNPAAVAGQQLLLRVSDPQAVRVRIYDSRGVILPVPSSSRPGERLLSGGVASIDVQLELRAYPGSPYGHGITLDPMFDPLPGSQTAFTIDLIARDGAGHDTILDTGRFSAAPILFLDNGVRATRLYVCDNPDTQAALTDIRSALPALGGVRLVLVPATVGGGDTWLQDQFQPGIAVGGDRWRHVIIHLPRLRGDFHDRQSQSNLSSFVTSHFPARNVGLLQDFWTRTLSFADATGQQVNLPFVDCIALSNVMGMVPEAIQWLDDVTALIDRQARPHSGSWADLRRRLPEIVEDFARRARNAERTGQDGWNGILRDWVTAARRRSTAVVQALPAGTVSGAFQAHAGGHTVELAGDLADQVLVRVQQLESSANYGGNIESTPPTPTAPLGCTVVGNAFVRDQREHVDPDLLALLHAQPQPIIEIDSSWLDVGHVDEMLTFVPRPGGPAGSFAALRASSGLAMDLIRTAAARYRAGLNPNDPQTDPELPPSGVLPRLTASGASPVSRLLRGKLWEHREEPPTAAKPLPDIVEPPRIYQRLVQLMEGGDPLIPGGGGYNVSGLHYWAGAGPARVYPADISVLELLYCEPDGAGESTNDFVESQFLTPVDAVLADRLPGVPVFTLPVLFDRTSRVASWRRDEWSASTSAFTPDLVNLQVINGHLLMPRPNGPRMRPADAQAVLDVVLQRAPSGEFLRRQLTPSLLTSGALRSTVSWIHRHESIARPITASGLLRNVFAGLTTIDDVAMAFKDGFPGVPASQVADRIRRANPREFTPTGELRDGWRKLSFDEGTVDLFEAYCQLVARALGLRIDWVDTWFYHTHFGGIHCGTNVIREPEPGWRQPRWW